MGQLRRDLESYVGQGNLPFHMPGHKRRALGESAALFGLDVTELPDTDDLHEAEGILKEAQQRAARLYGAKDCFFLVNGSTVGILAAISAALPAGGKILMQRSSHKSAYHAVMLRRLQAVYLYEEEDAGCGAGLGVAAEAVEQALAADPAIAAVFLTSPGYEGFSADLQSIARIVHAKGIPLIVDAAHGAHFGFSALFPGSAVQAGADAVIMSVHKSLPAPTQTALLHVNGPFISCERVQRWLNVYESSSPSYPLMIAIDDCMEWVEHAGEAAWTAFYERRRRLSGSLKGLQNIELRDAFSEGAAARPEPGKMLLCPKNGGSGVALAGRLRELGIECEMALPRYVLLICTVADTDEMYERLAAALQEADRLPLPKNVEIQKKESLLPCIKGAAAAMSLSDAWEAETEAVPLHESAGRICASMVMAYPPGRPLLLPGELVTGDILRQLNGMMLAGCELQMV